MHRIVIVLIALATLGLSGWVGYRAMGGGDPIASVAIPRSAPENLPDTPAGHYHSVVLTRIGEDRPERDLRLAYNSADSQSGWAATDGAPFAVCIPTGAHRASAEAVSRGAADVAFVDAVTWRLVEAYDPDLAQRLTVRRRTRPTPGLPLIAARGSDLSPLREGISHALDRLTASRNSS